MEDKTAIKKVNRLVRQATHPQVTISPTHISMMPIFNFLTSFVASITAIAFSPDGKLIYSGAMKRIEVHTSEGTLIEKNYVDLHSDGVIYSFILLNQHHSRQY